MKNRYLIVYSFNNRNTLKELELDDKEIEILNKLTGALSQGEHIWKYSEEQDNYVCEDAPKIDIYIPYKDENDKISRRIIRKQINSYREMIQMTEKDKKLTKTEIKRETEILGHKIDALNKILA